jgi:Ser/Thr protein kinase RdoA (MazF antagonist)
MLMSPSSRRVKSHFPVTHSILSTAALMAEVLPDYDIGTPVECKLLDRSLNDTYLVKTTDERYILRIYRARWRSLPEVRYELDALTHLAQKDLSISTPLATKDGRFIRTLHAPEGDRQAVLFTYAKGKALTHEGQQSELYGRAVAAVHAATDDFVSQHQRFALDVAHLIDRPLEAIQPFLEHRPEDWAYLEDMADRVRKRLDRFQRERLDFGFCHGDFHGGNAHIDTASTITFFDFDCCGAGWRAYDIAVFRWAAGREDANWESFLKGYRECRHLAVRDLAAVPWFVTARHIWLLGLHTGNAHDWSHGWMDDAYFDSGGAGGLKFLREWEAEHLNNQSEAT